MFFNIKTNSYSVTNAYEEEIVVRQAHQATEVSLDGIATWILGIDMLPVQQALQATTNFVFISPCRFDEAYISAFQCPCSWT